MGIGKAKELIYTSRIIDAREAADIGLVQHCVPQNNDGDAAYKKALEIAKQIMSNVCVYKTHRGRNHGCSGGWSSPSEICM